MDNQKKWIIVLLAIIALLITALCINNAYASDNIRIVGSSTVYPFATVVAENFAKGGFLAPIVESTGTGGGFKMFCGGEPDMVNASREIKDSELDNCFENNIVPLEVKIGYDGLVIATSKNNADFTLTKGEIFLALTKTIDGNPNPYVKWSDINPSFPQSKIEVLGPPPTSGTRDSFIELVMHVGAEELGITDWNQSLREDGAYIDAGENDNLIVQKLQANPEAIGIFGYSFLEENLNVIKGISIDGIEPTYDTISSGEYTVARPLFVYANLNKIDLKPELKDFLIELSSNKALGEDGYLAAKGLVPLPEDELELVQKTVEEAL